MGFQISITATTIDGSVNCGGSATFNVMAGKTASVVVALTCHEAPRTGSVMVSGTLNVCPTIDGINANPAEVKVGGSIALSVAAHDSDAGPAALGYAWTASGNGTLSNANTANPTFNCNAPGTATLTVTVSDGDPLATCAATQSAQVNCTVGRADARHLRRRRLPQPHHLLGRLDLDAEAGQEVDRHGRDALGPRLVRAGRPRRQRQPQLPLVEDASLSTPAYPFVSGLRARTPPGRTQA